MSDSTRFPKLASFIAQRYPKYTKICDVAGGQGFLQVELNLRGFTNVITVDDRPWTKREPNLLYQRKWIQEVDEKFDLLIGLHSDGATDWIIRKSAELESDFIIIPCCVIPSAYPYMGGPFSSWVQHLEIIAQNLGFTTQRFHLKIKGKNLLIWGRL